MCCICLSSTPCIHSCHCLGTLSFILLVALSYDHGHGENDDVLIYEEQAENDEEESAFTAQNYTTKENDILINENNMLIQR